MGGRGWGVGRLTSGSIGSTERLAEVRERGASVAPRRRTATGPATCRRSSSAPGWTGAPTRPASSASAAAIADGEIYQANLTRRLATPFRGDPWPLYRRLRTGDPALFAAFLDLGPSPLNGAAAGDRVGVARAVHVGLRRWPRRHEPDQGHPPAWPRPRGRSPARLRAPRVGEGPRRERDDRRRAPERPRAGLLAGHRPRPAPVPPRADGRRTAPGQHRDRPACARP